MQSSQNLKDVLRLVGRITALSHFISHLAYKSLCFFKVIKKVHSFQWDEQCENKFQELKEYMCKLLILTRA